MLHIYIYIYIFVALAIERIYGIFEIARRHDIQRR